MKKIHKYHHYSFLSMLIYKPLILLFLLFILPLFIWATGQNQQLTSQAQLVFHQAESSSCPTSSSNTYGTIDPLDKYPAGDPPPQQHPDLNIIDIRGYVPTQGEKYPVVLGEAGDPKAPQIWKILDRLPIIDSLYKIYGWDWSTNRKTTPMNENSYAPVQMIGLQTTKGEEIKVPDSGYRIGGNYQVMVIFANNNNITVKYGREDNIGIKFGYAIQISGICVDPNLLNLYNQLNSSGRNDLPALEGGKTIGTANDTEIKVAVRDTGDFLDPRSKLDWWQGVDYPIPSNNPVAKPTNNPIFPSSTSAPSVPIIPSATPITSIDKSPPPIQATFTPSPSIPIGPTFYPTLTKTPSIPTYIPPTITPTSTSFPIIDIKKTAYDTQIFIKRIIISVIQFARIILP